jgi:hypothetical protein
MRTRDGYAVTMPRFRVRRLARRLRTGRDHPRWRAASRLFDLVIGRARRLAASPAQFPVFATRVGRRPVWITTRAIAPRRVELLYIRYVPR